MSATKIRGDTQILDGSILNAQINASAAIATSKLAEGPMFLHKDGSVAMEANFNMGAGTYKIINLADGSANSDAVNYSQLQSVATQGKSWKEVILYQSQLLDGASGGIYAGQIVKLTTNFAGGEIVSLHDGSSQEDFECVTSGPTGNQFLVGASITDTLANLGTKINDNSGIAVTATTGNLDSVDGTNTVLIIWQDTIAEPTRVFGNAGAAADAVILDSSMDNCYESLSADLIALPSSDPAATNFGFSRAKGALVTNETHLSRENDSSYTWDSDAEAWNMTGATSIPYASKTVYGKVKIEDGLSVASGLIAVEAEANEGIVVSSAGVAVDYDNATIGITGNQLAVLTVQNANLANSTITVTGDSGTQAIDLGDTLTVTGSDPIDTDVSGDTLTISIDDAAYATKGAASFNSDHFSVTTGAVSLAINGIDETLVDWGSGANQIDATSIPLDSGGTWAGSAATVQDALEELEAEATMLAFKTIIISGQSDVVADTRDDTLTLVAGTDITLATTGDQITISSSGSSSVTASLGVQRVTDDFRLDFTADKGLTLDGNSVEVEVNGAAAMAVDSSGLAVVLSSTTGPGLAFDGTDGGLTIDLASNPGLEFSGGNLIAKVGDGLDLDGTGIIVDVTDFIDTSYGLTENNNDIRINLAADEGLYFNGGALAVEIEADKGISVGADGLAAVAGDGIDIDASGIAVDVTDVIDTNYGLTEDSNNIQINLASNEGLYFNSGALGVSIESNKGLSVGASGLATVVDGDAAMSVGASGLAVVVETDGGIAFDGTNGGLEIKLDGSSLAVGASGLKMGAMTSDFIWFGVSGAPALRRYATRESPNETPNGAITQFTVDYTPIDGQEMVFLNGILQNPGGGNDYTLDTGNKRVTFASAPETGDVILVTYLATD